jgi:hypothetical protein
MPAFSLPTMLSLALIFAERDIWLGALTRLGARRARNAHRSARAAERIAYFGSVNCTVVRDELAQPHVRGTRSQSAIATSLEQKAKRGPQVAPSSLGRD